MKKKLITLKQTLTLQYAKPILTDDKIQIPIILIGVFLILMIAANLTNL